MAQERSHPGRKPGVSIPDLLELLPQSSTSDWKKAAKTELGVSSSAFHRSLTKIKAGNHAFKAVETGWEAAKSA